MLLLIPLAIIFTTLSKGIATYLHSFQMSKVAHSIIATLQSEMFQKLMFFNLYFFNDSKSGNLISRLINDTYFLRMAIVKTITGEYKLARIIAFTALPVLVGFATYNTIYPSFQEPVELRTVHPAPPATTKVHGKTYPLESTNNPFRIDEQDNYKDSFPFLDAEKHEYMKYVTEGGTIFFQNCHYCHGDQLNGLGMFSHVFNPTPANFIDPGTIAMLQEAFLFWRVSKGGPGLPNESTPWSSAMPPWEEHLKTEEIWKVILFEYWYTGWHPRTFGTEGSTSGGGE